MNLLITGAAGFIGFHVSQRLLERGDSVIGLDFLGDYYDVNLKLDRLKELGIDLDIHTQSSDKFIISKKYPKFIFKKTDIAAKEELQNIFAEYSIDAVINLAAQAGVRYSLSHPEAYIQSNIIGFANILECCRNYNVRNLVYASSSSVYGLNTKIPFSENDSVDHPISLYAASKKSNELMAHVYSHLFGIRCTGLRFFTVYGPWGRPDMASFLFVKSILSQEKINLFNNGDMQRDFTFIDDIVNGIEKIVDKPAESDPTWNSGINGITPFSSNAPFRVYNIGNSKPVKLMDFIKAIEKRLGIKARINLMPLQPGDVVTTFADVSLLKRDFDYTPSVDITEGIDRYITWYQSYYSQQPGVDK